MGGSPLVEQGGAATAWPQGRGVDGSAPGRIRLGALLFVLAAAAGIYLAINFIPPYWTYLSMQDPVKEAAMAAAARGDEARVRADLIRRAKELDLTLEEDNIEITRDGPMLLIRVSWVARVDLPRYRYDIPFRVEERVPLR